jgi:transposase
MMSQLFAAALNIVDPWFVKDIQFSAENKRLDIHLDFRKGAVFHYTSVEDGISGDFKVYDTVQKQWRHLNFFQHECYLHARIPRVDIDEKTKRQIDPPWSGKSNGFTLLFEALILQLATHMPVHTVGRIINESDYKIWNMLEHYVNATLAKNDYRDLKAIGLDETAKSRGHNYITLFVDLLKKRTVFIAEGHGKDTISEFTKDLEAHNGNIQAIKDVSCDMSLVFITGINEYLPDAKITFDKYHIMKIINSAVNTVRIAESKTQPILKGTKFVFLKNEVNLTQAQRKKRSELSLSHTRLKAMKALHMRECFQDIYLAKSADEFESMMNRWYFWATHSRMKPMIEAARTIKAHWEGVMRWHQSRINNGLLEGLNSLIQAAKAKARGFRTFRYFRIMAFLVTGRLDFTQVNKCYVPI